MCRTKILLNIRQGFQKSWLKNFLSQNFLNFLSYKEILENYELGTQYIFNAVSAIFFLI